MPLNFIIMAALALVALLVVLFIFGDKVNIVNKQTTKYCDGGKASREELSCSGQEVPVYRRNKNAEDSGGPEYVWCCDNV